MVRGGARGALGVVGVEEQDVVARDDGADVLERHDERRAADEEGRELVAEGAVDDAEVADLGRRRGRGRGAAVGPRGGGKDGVGVGAEERSEKGEREAQGGSGAHLEAGVLAEADAFEGGEEGPAAAAGGA